MPGSLIQQFLNFVWSNPLVLFSPALAFGLMGLIMCVVSWTLINKGKSRKNWPSVPGKITSSKAPRIITLDLGARDIERFIPHVRFSYIVEGTTYHGELDVAYDSWQFRSKAERLVRHYPAGMNVTIYYDPKDPKNSVLQRSSARNIVGMIVGILMLVLGITTGCMWLLAVLSGFKHS